MSDLRTAALRALEYMKSVGQMDMYPEEWAIVERLEAALEEPKEPVQEPVAQAMQDAVVYGMGISHGGKRIDPDSIYKKAEPVQDPVCRDDGMPTSADERYLRRLLAYRVAMPGAYYDDGEAHGAQHGIQIDFMREPVGHIDAKLRALNIARVELQRPAEPVEPVGRVVNAHCEYATVQWLKQTSDVGGGDPKNSRSWPISGDAVYIAPPQRPAAPIIQPEIKDDKPFGYFRAEPFGWTDCAPTDEGAIPLYERPKQPPTPPEAQTEAEKIAYCAGWWAAMDAKREQK